MNRVAGVLVLAAGALTAWSTVGCGPSHYVNETLYGPTRMPTTHTDPMEMPEVGPDEFTAASLEGTPVGVQSAFRQDHDGAAITCVRPVLQPTGLIVYEITYVDDGVAGQTVYLPNGTAAAATYEEGPVVAHPRSRDAIEWARREAAARAPTAAPPATRPATRPVD